MMPSSARNTKLRPAAAAVLAAGCVALAGCGSGSTPQQPTTVTVTQSATPSASPSTSSATPATLKAAYERVRGSVVRVQTAACDGYGQGSGFVIGDRLVATAAHVVDGSQAVRVILGTTSTTGEVLGLDQGTDVALIRTGSALGAKPLTLAAKDPEVGDAVAGIGYTRGDPISFKTGTVNGLERKAVIDGIARHSMIEFDAVTNHGNSGGPVIDANGTVVGLVDAGPEGEPGQRLAVSARVAGPLLKAWRQSPEPPTPPACPTVPGPNGSAVPAGLTPTSSIRQALQTLDLYFASVNNGDFPTAVAQLAKPTDLERFTAAVTSSQDRDFEVNDIRMVDGAPVVWLSFVSEQEAGKGPAGRENETCTQWSQDYYFVKARGLWLIDRSAAHPGQPRNAPC